MDTTDMTLAGRLDRAASRAGIWLAAWWRANAWGLGFCWTLAALAHGSFLTSPSYTVDEELYPLSNQTRWFLIDGRWALWAFKTLTAPLGLAPYQCTFLALALAGLAVWLAAQALEDEPAGRCVLAALFVTSPVLAYIVPFTFSAAGVFFGLACATGACLLARRARFRLKSRGASAGCALLVWLGLSVYQCLGLAYAAFVFLYCLRRLLGLGSRDEAGPGRALAFGAATGAAGLALYVCVDALVKLVYAIPLVRDYQVGMFEWGSADAWTVAGKVANGVIALFGHSEPVVGAFARLFPWLALGTALLVLARRGVRRGPALAALAGACLTPFALHAGLGHVMPVRIMYALALCGAGLYAMVWDMSRPFVRAALLAGAALFVVNNAYTVNKLHDWQQASLRQDAILARELVSRIEEVALPEERGHTILVALAGRVRRPANAYVIPSEVFGQSFFEWDGGDTHRMVSYMRYFGFLRVASPPLDREKAALVTARGLPAWPAAGSVKRLPDGVVAVNLGN